MLKNNSALRAARFGAVVGLGLLICVVAAPRGSRATQSCGSGFNCQNESIPLHLNLTTITGQGIGTNLVKVQFRQAMTIAQDGTPTHVDIGWAACGSNYVQAMLGLDCIAQHYWNIGTIAQDYWAFAVANTKLAQNTNTGVTPAPVVSLTGIAPNVTILISDANPETVTVASVNSATSPPNFTPTMPGFAHTHSSGATVVTSPTVQPFVCTDVHNSDPYDPRWAWLTNLAPQTTPFPIVDNSAAPANSAIEHFASTSTGDGSGLTTQTNEAYEAGTKCASAGNLEEPKFGVNLNSYATQVALDSELQGEPGYPAITIDGSSLQATPYPWASPGTSGGGTGTVCGAGGPTPAPCPEPTYHIDVYPLVAADRQYATATCMTGNSGTPGGFIENDPGATGTTPAPLLPGIDAMHVAFYSQIKHNSAEADPRAIWFDGSPLTGRPFYFTANGGSCQDKTQPAYVSTWYLSAGNMFMLNDEDTLVDSTTCGNSGSYPTIAEPARRNASALFAVNTMTDFISYRRRYQFENSCSENYNSPDARANLGGMDDVSLRYWLLGVAWLAYDPKYTFVRDNLIGSQNNNATGADVYGEEQIVPLDPVSSAGTYATPNPGFTANGGCPASGPIIFSNGEGGGVGTLAAPNGSTGTCGPTHQNGALFQNAPVAARQFRSCYLRGNFVGPCAVVVNFHFTNSTCDMACAGAWIDTSSVWTNTFGSGGALVSYQHILNLNDAVNGANPCPAQHAGNAGGPFVSKCAIDVFEKGPASSACFDTTGPLATFDGTCLDISDYSVQLIVLSGASTQGDTCEQGVGVPVAKGGGGPGSLTVCEAEAVLLFK